MNTGFYVSAIDTPERKYLMLGPFETKAEAEEKVKAAVDKAMAIDASGRAWFMAWGTAKLETPDTLPAGRLNKFMEA